MNITNEEVSHTMAKRNEKELLDTLRARGLRKRVAKSVADAIGSGPRKSQPKAVTKIVNDLKGLVEVIEDRATGKTAKRRSAARKAAVTRKRKAQTRSAAAKKAARTRSKAKATTTRTRTAGAGRRTRAKAS